MFTMQSRTYIFRERVNLYFYTYEFLSHTEIREHPPLHHIFTRHESVRRELALGGRLRLCQRERALHELLRERKPRRRVAAV